MKERRPTEIDDAAGLLTRIASGNEPALREFYQSYHRQVYAFALKRLREPADAADVLNEVMLEVWRSAGRFEGRSRALTWVLGIAHHKTVDHFRRRKNHPQDELDAEMEDENSPTAFDVYAGAENASLLRRCLDGLSEMHRQIMHLAYFEDLSCEEISEISECPVGTVKTRMFHARRLLKRCLGALAEATG
ncbi:MAG: sigma-70 family RNA polymerase sigma factor [Sulfuricaulis sp.]|uniref:sigma-70 family RNA polymerase sigma factor n=1 Tax=Sulfuricaulis sp. TaxID=2003553 RepID=UPI0025D2DB52|nr:sigma-70 family RNA polymerase sigma factor [Sulfuricaulis sp.]MCR4348069.1 sigma-70 family RNA polymerase sigma factor [Sulfuricaulis sp.]